MSLRFVHRIIEQYKSLVVSYRLWARPDAVNYAYFTLKSCKVHKAQCFNHTYLLTQSTLTSQTTHCRYFTTCKIHSMPNNRSRLARTQPARTDEYINALFATQYYNPALNSASAHHSRHRARTLVARTATPRSTLAAAVSHDLRLHNQRHFTYTCRPIQTNACSCFTIQKYLICLCI